MFVITVVGKRWGEVLESHYQRRKLWPESLKGREHTCKEDMNGAGLGVYCGVHSGTNWIAQRQEKCRWGWTGEQKLRNCTAKVLVVGKHRDTESLIHQISMSGKLLRLNSDQSHRPGSWVLLEDKIVWQVCRCLYQVSNFLFIFMVDLSKSLGMWGL